MTAVGGELATPPERAPTGMPTAALRLSSPPRQQTRAWVSTPASTPTPLSSTLRHLGFTPSPSLDALEEARQPPLAPLPPMPPWPLAPPLPAWQSQAVQRAQLFGGRRRCKRGRRGRGQSGKAFALPVETGCADMLEPAAESPGAAAVGASGGFAAGCLRGLTAPQTMLHFSIALRRADATEFGLVVSESGAYSPGALRIDAVRRGSAFHAWNLQCNGPRAWRALRPGDELVVINGVRGAACMIEEMQSRELLRLTVSRQQLQD